MNSPTNPQLSIHDRLSGTHRIGRLQCDVIDVNDLAVAEAFWSELTGLPVIPSVFPGRYSYLGQADPWRHEVILHLVRAEKGPEPNRSHVDIWVRDVDRAIEQVEAYEQLFDTGRWNCSSGDSRLVISTPSQPPGRWPWNACGTVSQPRSTCSPWPASWALTIRPSRSWPRTHRSFPSHWRVRPLIRWPWPIRWRRCAATRWSGLSPTASMFTGYCGRWFGPPKTPTLSVPG